MSVRLFSILDLKHELRDCEPDGKIVRIHIDNTEINSGVTQVAIHVSFRVGGELHLMEVIVGENVQGKGAGMDGTNEAHDYVESVSGACKELGLELRGGIIED